MLPTPYYITGVKNPNAKQLSAEEFAYCSRIISSDALAMIIADRTLRKIPTSLIRMADGERAIIRIWKGEQVTDAFLHDSVWLAKYGLSGADLKIVGRDLIQAGLDATFLACSLTGLHLEQFKVWPWFDQRPQFVDQFYHLFWNVLDRVHMIVTSSTGVIILHRKAPMLAPIFQSKYNVPTVGIPLSTWSEHAVIISNVQNRPEQLVLVSGGPSGKKLIVDLAQQTGKTVLDLGEALDSIWLCDYSVMK